MERIQKTFNKAKDFSQRKRTEFVLLVGLGFVVFGSFLLVVFPKLLRFGFDMNFRLQEGKFIFENWKELPVPLWTRVYLFDIQNPDEFRNGGIPQIKEIGPYVYKQYRTREILGWSDNNRKVKFMESLRFEFDENSSVGPLTDMLTLVNVPLLIIFSIINTAVEMFPLTPVISPIVNNVVNTLLVTHRESLIERRTVEQVLNGRRIGLLDTIDIVAKPLRMMGLPIPEYGISSYKLKDNKYGFLAIRNDSAFGPFEAYTGMEDTRSKFSKIASYQGKRSFGIYRHKSCDAINGTDGTFFGTFPDPSKSIYVMNVHACRSLRFDYAGDTYVKGVSAYRYEMSDDTFDGPEYNRQNWCFCPKGVEPRKCHGLLDMGQCLAGVPFAMTLPHFLNSQRFLSGVRGLSPDREKHMGYFDIEKTLGITLRGFARFQINLKLRPFNFVPGLNNFRATLLPYLWFEEGATVEGPLGLLLKAGSWSINGAYYAFILTILLGVGIAMMSSLSIYKKRRELNKFTQNGPQISNNLPNNALVRPEDTYGITLTTDQAPSNVNIQRDIDFESGIQETGKALPDRTVQSPSQIYPNLNQMNGEINTISKSVEIGIHRNGRQPIESGGRRKSVINEQGCSHSVQSDILLPPVENGDTYTTLIIQRKPFPNEINNNV